MIKQFTNTVITIVIIWRVPIYPYIFVTRHNWAYKNKSPRQRVYLFSRAKTIRRKTHLLVVAYQLFSNLLKVTLEAGVRSALQLKECESKQRMSRGTDKQTNTQVLARDEPVLQLWSGWIFASGLWYWTVCVTVIFLRSQLYVKLVNIDTLGVRLTMVAMHLQSSYHVLLKCYLFNQLLVSISISI